MRGDLYRVKKKNKDITKVKILSKHCDKFHDYTKPFYNNFCIVIYKNMSISYILINGLEEFLKRDFKMLILNVGKIHRQIR